MRSFAAGRWALLALGLVACSGDEGNDIVDAMTAGDGGLTEAGALGGNGALDGGLDGGFGDASSMGPLAPMVTSPAAQSKAAGTLDVVGVATPGAEVLVKLILGDQVLVRRTLVASVDGSFSVDLSYRGVGHLQAFTVEVVQVTAAGASPATKVPVVHDVPFTISGQLLQASGPTKGSQVFVRLYRNADVAHILDYVAEQVVTVAAGSAVTASYSLPAAAGAYWVRAFRDSAGPTDAAPDGQPSFGFDAQVVAPVTVANPNFNFANLTLRGAAMSADHYEGFNVMYSNVTPQAIPPSQKVGDKRLAGKGRCLGFFVDAGATRAGLVTAVSKPMLKLPSGQLAELKDDGACSEAVRDNTGSSYDETVGDKQYRFGIANPDERSEGVYTFFYLHPASGHVHVQTDELKAKVQMPLLREVTSPDGTVTLKTRTPKITWAAVPGAKLYEARLRALSGVWDNVMNPKRLVGVPEYTPDVMLTDNTCYELIISAFDANPFTEDVDAFAYAQTHNFCVDVVGNKSIEISGTITNKTGQNYPLMLSVSSDDAKVAASVRVAANATKYKVGLLAVAAGTGSGSLKAFIDRAGSGIESSLENQGYQVSRANLTLEANLDLPLVFNPRVVAQVPVWFGEVETKTTFKWEDYAMTAGASKPAGPFVYAVWVGAEAAGVAPVMYVLPSTVTSLDFANLPTGLNSVDLAAFAACADSGGVFSTSVTGMPVCTGGAAVKPVLTELASSSLYVWAVAVIECNFADLMHPAKSVPAVDANPFLTCVQKALVSGTTFAQSAATPFFVK